MDRDTARDVADLIMALALLTGVAAELYLMAALWSWGPGQRDPLPLTIAMIACAAFVIGASEYVVRRRKRTPPW